MKALKTASLLLLIAWSSLSAQYFGETVLEKSFEQTDFFFKPAYVNPYGIGNFGSSLLGLVDNPLLNLQINPAFIAQDSLLDMYGYINFRNSEEKRGYSAIPMLCYTRSYIPYPWYYSESRRKTEPIISAAFFTQPFSIKGKPVRLGITYQAIFIDEDFYEIPQDVYRSAVGLDYSGNKSIESDYNVTDRYKGADNMHQEGHFVTLFTGLNLNKFMDAGIRASGVFYTRNGKYENTYQWDNGMSSDNISRSSYISSRNQDYSHYDISSGIITKFSPKVSAGITGGYLWGNVDQAKNWGSSSTYQHGVIDQGTSWSYYYRNGTSDESWTHKGKTYYGGINLKFLLGTSQTLTLFYRTEKQGVDIDLKGDISDTSYSNYHNENENWKYSSEHISHLYDNRTGNGDWCSWSHHLGAGLIWPVDKRTKVSLGMQYRTSKRTVSTLEDVYADRGRQGYRTSTSSENEWISTVAEKKMLDWQFISKVSSIQIPVFVTCRISKNLKLLTGLTRTFTSSRTSDITTAYFDYRTTNESGKIENKEKFGERYTEPEDIRNNVSTTLLFGATITPSRLFDIQVLMVPNFYQSYYSTSIKELQWWIDFNFYPERRK
ncbi:hypothetical protein J7K93_12700 [bacterium]|nr:hypothetical protein [bacterium]